MALVPTQHVPALSLPLVGGGTSDDLEPGSGAGGRFTLVVFFRGLHCPVCRKQLAELDRRIEDLRAAGVGRVVAVSMEDAERSAILVDRWRLQHVPVAYGLTAESARAWGLYLSTGIKADEPAMFNEPGIFVLDADGTLFWSSVATMPFGRPLLDDVIAGLDYATAHDYPARGAA